jgi:tryptophan 2,3-dioxygenase
MEVSCGMRETSQNPAYREILRLDELLNVTLVHDGRPDRMLFLVTHQICEMWFALILEHLIAARAAMLAGDPARAVDRIDRLPVIMRILTAQFDALAMLSVEAFERIRTEFGSASGIQSSQWREIEFACGLREVKYLNVRGFTEAEKNRLRAHLDEISVADAYDQLARRRGNSPHANPAELERLRAALLTFDESVVAWRARHASLAEQFLGGSPGTGGSDGSAYLWRMTGRRLFPIAWPIAGCRSDVG